MSNAIAWSGSSLVEEVERRSGTPASACFQCHKCSTGCPVAPEMDLVSSQIMRLIHLGAEAEVLQSRAIWLCASCEACTARCPMDIDVAGVMDALRMMAVERNSVAAGARTEVFNRTFLGSVRRHGRVFELGMMAAYKLRSGDLWGDVGKFPALLGKGKIALLPKSSGATAEVRDVFRRAAEEEQRP